MFQVIYIAADLKADYNIDVTPQTARNIMTEADYNGLAASKKLCMNLCNGERVLSFQRSIKVSNYFAGNRFFLKLNENIISLVQTGPDLVWIKSTDTD
ncbi:hypothetical protein AVEN_78415-1 [Araneus ventricosus]|uniref:Uncharacterized protein n=1 Tax=Araneus ventricosus TaxID=182803 RepID=A0A4Y2VBY0_ARAVE|nr:hypothetical protein AVEN_78415-1 [Araneus ventricosus]